ncbi:MAG TPA: MOSC domain-containing protein [Fibrobacteres bacterium]|nr:MOSC domain-containing protein [Fibrobacterota bacterium]
MNNFTIVSVNISLKKGTTKKPVDAIYLVKDYGIRDDAHAGPWHRQVSLLSIEDIDFMRAKGFDVHPGDFAENITTRGIVLPELPIGARLNIGEAILEVTQIGKECHKGCEIMKQTGDCVMPKRGIFAKVIYGGVIDTSIKGSEITKT